MILITKSEMERGREVRLSCSKLLMWWWWWWCLYMFIIHMLLVLIPSVPAALRNLRGFLQIKLIIKCFLMTLMKSNDPTACLHLKVYEHCSEIYDNILRFFVLPTFLIFSSVMLRWICACVCVCIRFAMPTKLPQLLLILVLLLKWLHKRDCYCPIRL